MASRIFKRKLKRSELLLLVAPLLVLPVFLNRTHSNGSQTQRVQRKRLPRTLLGHASGTVQAVFSPDGKTLASIGSSAGRTSKAQFPDEVALWDVSTGFLKGILKRRCSVTAMTFSPNGRIVAFADYNVALWNGRSARPHLTISVGGGLFVKSLAFSPDGKILAGSRTDGTVKLWDARSGALLRVLKSDRCRAAFLWFSPDGKVLAATDRYNRRGIVFFEVNTGKWLRTLPLFWELPGARDLCQSAFAFSPDWKRVAALGSTPQGEIKLRLCSTQTGTVLWSQTPDNPYYMFAQVAAFSPNGKMVASSEFLKVNLRRATTGERLHTLSWLKGGVRFVSFSPDGKTLVCADGGSNEIELWDISDLKP